MTPFLITAAALWLFALAVAWITAAAERLDRDIAAVLAEEAADWSEPTRAEVEQQWAADEWAEIWAAFGYADETPIYTATAKHIARQEAAGIEAEWAEWGGTS